MGRPASEAAHRPTHMDTCSSKETALWTHSRSVASGGRSRGRRHLLTCCRGRPVCSFSHSLAQLAPLWHALELGGSPSSFADANASFGSVWLKRQNAKLGQRSAIPAEPDYGRKHHTCSKENPPGWGPSTRTHQPPNKLVERSDKFATHAIARASSPKVIPARGPVGLEPEHEGANTSIKLATHL